MVAEKISELPGNTLLVHSDVMRGFPVAFEGREAFLNSHLTELGSLRPNLNLWMPTFNYAFCKGEEFDVQKTTSQVGSLTEHFRKETAHWRTPVPVFSFCGTGPKPAIDIATTIDPFGVGSAFDFLYLNSGTMMHYGSTIRSSTILHYAERESGVLCYRYDKLFLGSVRTSNSSVSVKFNFHVRPIGKHLDYNWPLIESDLVSNGILYVFSENQALILLCEVDKLVNFWISKLKENPLYLLDSESKVWVEPLLDKLGRSFLISDFENLTS